jgi:hypothetical protein
MGLAKATVERLTQVVQGIKAEYDTEGNIIRVWLPNLIGQLDSSIRKQCTVHEILAGKEATEANEPLNVFDFWSVGPGAEMEITFDAASQRFIGTNFIAYSSPDHLDPDGLETYGASRLVA